MTEPVIIRKQANPATEIVDIDLIPTEFFILGQRSIVQVIKCGGTEGLTVAQIAEMTNSSERSVRWHIHNHAIRCDGIRSTSLHSLKDAGVIPFRTTRAVFVPKEGVQQLLKLINTHESWAIYYQLWNNSEKLEKLEAKLLDTAGRLKAALDQSAIQKAMIYSQKLQITELEASLCEHEQTVKNLKAKDDELSRMSATLMATINFIENKGKGKRKCRHRLVEIEFAGVNLFEGPQYKVAVKKLEIAEMSGREQDIFAMQKGISSIRGIAGSMEERSERLGISNPEVRGVLKQLSAASDDAYHKLIPDAGKVFGLKDGDEVTFMN